MTVISPIYLQEKIDVCVAYNLRAAYDLSVGSFGYIKKSGLTNIIQFGSCRDSFQATPNNQIENGFLFCHHAERSYDVACFITKIENMLGIQNSVFCMTTFPNLTWIKMSPWWLTMEIRKSFFSMMLKCSIQYFYKSDNFEDALASSQYVRETRSAVNKFLAGYTFYEFKPLNDADHWFSQFTQISNTSGRYVPKEINIKKMFPGKELISKKAYELWSANKNCDENENWFNAERILREVC